MGAPRPRLLVLMSDRNLPVPALSFEVWSLAAAEQALLRDDQRDLHLEELGLGAMAYRETEAHWLGVIARELHAGDSTRALEHGRRASEMTERGKDAIVARLEARLAAFEANLPIAETFAEPTLDAPRPILVATPSYVLEARAVAPVTSMTAYEQRASEHSALAPAALRQLSSGGSDETLPIEKAPTRPPLPFRHGSFTPPPSNEPKRPREIADPETIQLSDATGAPALPFATSTNKR